MTRSIHFKNSQPYQHVPNAFDMETLVEVFPEISFSKNQLIYDTDSITDKVYYITRGCVILGSYNSEGKEVITTFLGRGQIFGEEGLNDVKNRREYAKAKTTTEVRVISLNKFRKMIVQNGNLGLYINQLILDKLLKSYQRWKSQVNDYSRAKIIDFLINLAKTEGKRVGYEVLVHNCFTQQEIADMVGASRQTVSTTLCELKQRNLIYFDRKRFLIRDMNELEASKYEEELA